MHQFEIVLEPRSRAYSPNMCPPLDWILDPPLVAIMLQFHFPSSLAPCFFWVLISYLIPKTSLISLLQVMQCYTGCSMKYIATARQYPKVSLWRLHSKFSSPHSHDKSSLTGPRLRHFCAASYRSWLRWLQNESSEIQSKTRQLSDALRYNWSSSDAAPQRRVILWLRADRTRLSSGLAAAASQPATGAIPLHLSGLRSTHAL